MLSLIFFLSYALSSPAHAIPNTSCTAAHLDGSGVQNAYTTPAGTFLKKAFIQKMTHECILEWSQQTAPKTLAVPVPTLLTKLLDYDIPQVENFKLLPSDQITATEVTTFSETPAGEKWRFRLKSRVKVVPDPEFFDVLAEAATNGFAGTQIQPIPGGSPGSDRVKYIQFRIRADRISNTQVKVRFETMSAVDISGFAAGIAFKMFQGSSNLDALKKFDLATLVQARRIGAAL
ncbi:MAG: hypothetical protein K2X47_12980 [Bdellovibrionales bacterium]|nr:hypothetical protein [Bdellovibrionales bacterium]